MLLLAVVIWNYLLGGVLYREESLSWSRPILPHQISGERRETGETSQYSLLTRNVSVSPNETYNLSPQHSLKCVSVLPLFIFEYPTFMLKILMFHQSNIPRNSDIYFAHYMINFHIKAVSTADVKEREFWCLVHGFG